MESFDEFKNRVPGPYNYAKIIFPAGNTFFTTDQFRDQENGVYVYWSGSEEESCPAQTGITFPERYTNTVRNILVSQGYSFRLI